MNNKQGFDTTEGNVFQKMMVIVIPMLLGNFLNVFYNIVDSIWIGQIVGDLGLAAIAVSFPILMVLMSIAMGITVASNVIVGQFFGAKNYGALMHISRVASTISLFMALALSTLGYIFAPTFMRMLNAPQSVLDLSISYFRISMIGFPFVFYYFLTSALLRGIGDSVRPLVFLFIASAINIILDPIMIKGMFFFPKMGLDGAAYATVISQVISVIISVSYLKIKNSVVRVNPFRFSFDIEILKNILKIGIPFASMQLIVSFAWMFVTGIINSFGEIAGASLAVVNRIDSILIMPAVAISGGVATMTAQNIGAGKFDRIKEISKIGVIMSIIVCAVIVGLVFIFPDKLVGLFTPSTDILKYTMGYIYISMPSLIFLSVMFALNGVINGAGKTFILMVFSFINLIAIRSPLAYFLSKQMGINGVWTAAAITCLFSMIFSISYYKFGNWRTGSDMAHVNKKSV